MKNVWIIVASLFLSVALFTTPGCADSSDDHNSLPDPSEILPSLLPQDYRSDVESLEPPEGVVWSGGGSGSHGIRDGAIEMVYSDAILETTMNAYDLEVHYRDQLLSIGWEFEEQGTSDTLSWSTYSFTDKDGNHQKGLLIVRLLGENLRSLLLRADLAQ